MVSIQYTPIPQQEVIIHPSTGMNSYATITTDSYLSQALQGMMQNAAGYIGWSLDQWVQAFTAQAQQRCASYPESCAGTTPEILGQKYGAIAYQLMQTVTSSANTPQSTPTPSAPIPGPNNAFGPQGTPNSQVDVPSTINVPQSNVPQIVPVSPGIYIQTTGSGDYTVPGIPNPSLNPDYITQQNASQGAVSDNTTQSQIAQSGGTPVNPAIPPGTIVLPAALSWLGDTFAVGGMNIPIWIPLAAAVGFMFMQGQGSHRRY